MSSRRLAMPYGVCEMGVEPWEHGRLDRGSLPVEYAKECRMGGRFELATVKKNRRETWFLTADFRYSRALDPFAEQP